MPPMAPATSAVCELPVSLWASTLTVTPALPRPGSETEVRTWALVRVTGPERRRTTSRKMPMLWSGGVWAQSIQPMVRSLLGLLGKTRIASELFPGRTRPLTSKVLLVKAPATCALVATWVPLNQTSAREMMPERSRKVLSPEPGAMLTSARYHQGTVKSAGLTAVLRLLPTKRSG